MPLLNVSLLGRVEFIYPHTNHLPFRRSLRIALLAYLIRVGRPVSRKQLSETFWPNISSSQSRTYLRNMLQRLKSDFGAHLNIDKEYVSFKFSSESKIDVQLFAEEMDAYREMEAENAPDKYQKLSSALSHYAGLFLADYTREVSLPFDHWLQIERQSLHATAIEGYHKLLTHRLQNQEFEQGLTDTRHLLALEPFDEVGHLCMMQFFVMNNELRKAQSTFERYESLLNRDIGTTGLGNEIVELYKQIGRILHTQSGMQNFTGSQNPLVQGQWLEQELQQKIHFSTFQQVFKNELSQLHRLLVTERHRLVTIVNKDQNRLEQFLKVLGNRFAPYFNNQVTYIDFNSFDTSIHTAPAELEALFIERLWESLPPHWRESTRTKGQLIKLLGQRNALFILNNYSSSVNLKELITDLLVNHRSPSFLISTFDPLIIEREVALPFFQIGHASNTTFSDDA